MDLNLERASPAQRRPTQPSAGAAGKGHPPAEAVPQGGGANTAIATIGKHALIYGAGIAISKLAGFLLLPIYTRYLTPADYGVLELLGMTIELVGILTGMSLAASVFRFHAAYAATRDRHEVLSTAAIGLAVLSGAAAAVGVFASPALGRLLLEDTPRSALYFKLFFLIHLAQSVESVPLLHLRILNRSATFVAVNAAKLVVTLVLNIYLVVGLNLGVLGVLIGNLSVSTVSAVALGAAFSRQVPPRFSTEKFKSMLRFGYPVALSVVGNFILVFSDRYFIQHYVGTDAVGIYALGYKFAFLLSALAFTPFQQVWAAQRFEIANRPDAREVYSRVFLYLNIALGIVALGIGLFVGDVLTFMADPAFHGAIGIVPLLLAAQVIHHWSGYTNVGLFLNYRTSQTAWAAAAGVTTVLALNFILIPRSGIHGAVWATLGGYTVRFLVMHVLAQRQYRVDYGWGRIGLLYVILAAGLVVRRSIGNLPLVPSTALNSLITIAAIAALLATVLDAKERALIRRFLGRLALMLRGLSVRQTPQAG